MGIRKWINTYLADKEIEKLKKEVAKIEALEPKMKEKTDDELKSFSEELKNRAKNGESLDDLLYEAFALVREASMRVLGMRHYPVQLLGGIVLHQGRIAEMRTGEGKTLVATLPAYLNALSGKGVHVITVNDYLAKRDKDWMGKIHEFLGMSVGCITNDVRPENRKKEYLCDITYGTNNEFGFDYLRDNMVLREEELVQRDLNFAIIDEVDSILIDEARTPLIISGVGTKSTHLYLDSDVFVRRLTKDDYDIDEEKKAITLTESGVDKAEKNFNVENLSDVENMELTHHINQALHAHYMMKKDVDYVVKDGEILIVDEFTGRIMYGRRYSNGLHQAIEAKENLEVQKESQTLATITLQNYFRQYGKISGMTGTAKTEEDEFRHIYNMDVVTIPTNKKIQRVDKDDIILGTLKAKYNRIINEIVEKHKNNQPILVGTITIEVSEMLHDALRKKGINAQILNAKHHEKEAEIVAQAGRYGAVTIATNMAGRGTDIILGGNAEFMALKEMRKLGYEEYILNKVTAPFDYDDEKIREAKKVYLDIYSKFKAETDIEAQKVREAGGLHIIGTERHESRRIDNQLRGRAGRQGDVGSTQFYISLEDDLMRLFLPDSAKELVVRLGLNDDEAIEAKLLSRQIENAQQRVEGRNFGIRKHVLQYDDVMNKQRQIIYGERQRVLHGENIRDYVLKMAEQVCDEIVDKYTMQTHIVEEWDKSSMLEELNQMIFSGDVELEFNDDTKNSSLKEDLYKQIRKRYEYIESQFPDLEIIRDVERNILLRVVDMHWIDHIDAMEQLQQGIGLRAIGQKDPVQAYQFEGFEIFDEMIADINRDTVRYLFHIQKAEAIERESVASIKQVSHGENVENKTIRNDKKIGRNDECSCGSGKKYKKCCGKN